MIRAQFNRDGTFRSVTLPGRPEYRTDSPEVQWALSWLRLHDVDPLVVPLGAVVMYDAEFDEWRFPVMVRAAGGGVRMNAERTGPLIRVIRRRVRNEIEGEHKVKVTVTP